LVSPVHDTTFWVVIVTSHEFADIGCSAQFRYGGNLSSATNLPTLVAVRKFVIEGIASLHERRGVQIFTPNWRLATLPALLLL
jgi:hypothetical protein